VNTAWLQERPHLAALAQSMQTLLELADELYVHGRESGESVDYSAIEEQVAHAAAEIERGVHQVVLRGLDVDAPYIRVWSDRSDRNSRGCRRRQLAPAGSSCSCSSPRPSDIERSVRDEP
jgi:hypothetical protein